MNKDKILDINNRNNDLLLKPNMEIIYTTCYDLKDFRRNGKSNEIHRWLIKILESLPPEIRDLIEEDEVSIDYAIDFTKFPKNSLPYRFYIKGSKKLNSYFNNYVFLVKWI